MYKAFHLSPMIPSFDIPETASFLENNFAFKVIRDEVNYVILSKDDLTLHICKAGEDIGEMSVYLSVDNIDLLWDSIKDKLSGIKFREPFDREYGMREFHVIIPSTKTLMFVGHTLQRNKL